MMTSFKKLSTISAALTVGFLLAAKAIGIRVNTTDSMPSGIWRTDYSRHMVARGDVVLFCPPPAEIFRKAYELRILDWGSCDGGFSPMIKEVSGIPGDRIQLGHVVSINGVSVPKSKTQSKYFEPFKPSELELTDGEIWVLGTSSEASFDSRYFGPINETAVIGIMIPVWIWRN